MKEGSSQYQEIKELYEGYMARYGGDQVDAISLLIYFSIANALI